MVMAINLEGMRALVTGSEGFVGKHLVAKLMELGAKYVFTVLHRVDPAEGCDLTNMEHTLQMLKNATANAPLDYVFHLAGFNGGIQFNLDFPADIFYKNTVMGLNLLRACAKTRVRKVVSVVASCAYPDKTYAKMYNSLFGHRTIEPGVCNELNFFEGTPNPTVACHGFAKRNLQLATQFYHAQYGLDAVCACPTTIYGPGDSFDPERTKVMGGMIKRFVDAHRKQDPEVTVWGTGDPLREFIYVKDCVELLIRTARMYNCHNRPLNLGTGQELSISDLAEKVASIVGYQGKIVFDRTRADGQKRKQLDLSRMVQVLGKVPRPTPLNEGIMETVKFYRETYP